MNKRYEKWLEQAPVNIKKDLKKLTKKEIKENFYDDIKFGTAGMRGPIKLGTSFINKYTIAKAAFAYGKLLLEKHDRDARRNGVVIAHDNRRCKKEFSILTAAILSAMGISVYLFPNNKLQPTPLLSYTIAQNNYVGGINITASHNPPTDNGFKVYNADGKQMDSVDTNKIQKYMKQIPNVFKIPKSSDNIFYLEKSSLTFYIDDLMRQIPFNQNYKHKALKVVFTPQHGTSLTIAKKIMDKMKVRYTIVKEQATIDSEFSNTSSPNPQDKKAFDLAKKYGDRTKADILFSTDPDADRFGIVIKQKGKWVHIDGNQLPVVQLYWKLKKLRDLEYLRKGDFIVRSVVTSNFGDKIAKHFGINVYESLTGFKHIIAKAFEYEKKGFETIFAYEESYGSTIKTIVRDKDAFQALIQVIEIASELKAEGKTILDLYNDLQKEYGYHSSKQNSIKFTGPNGIEKASELIDKFRKIKKGSKLAGLNVTEVRDFAKGYKGLPKDNFITIVMGENSVSIRPSGTEPLLRIYGYGYGKTSKEANKNLKNILDVIK